LSPHLRKHVCREFNDSVGSRASYSNKSVEKCLHNLRIHRGKSRSLSQRKGTGSKSSALYLTRNTESRQNSLQIEFQKFCSAHPIPTHEIC